MKKSTEKKTKKQPNTKGRTYRNRVIMILSLVLAIVVTTMFVQEFILCNADHNAERIRGFYLEEENTIDVVAIGSSEVYCGFAPGLNYKEYGFTSYPYATEGSTARNFKTMFDEVRRTQDPKLIIIEINGAIYGNTNFDKDVNLRRVIDNIPMGKSKSEMIETEIEPDKRIEYYMPLIKYHGGWDNMGNSIGWSISMIQDKLRGYNMLKGIKTYSTYYDMSEKVIPSTDRSMKLKRPLFKKSHEALLEFLKYLKSEGFSKDRILFVRFPHVTTERNLTRYQRGNTIASIIRDNGFRFVSFEPDDPEINLDPEKDFYNIEHMNINGQQKFTRYLGKYLQTHYGITPTKLTEEQKEEWDKTIPYYDAYVKYCVEMLDDDSPPQEIGENYFTMREIKKYLDT